MSPRKLTPEEILDLIEEQDAADEAERILALSDEELDRELRQAGIDPQATRERGREIGRAMQAAEQAPPAADGWVTGAPPPPRSTPARWAVLLAATMTAAAVGGTLYAVGRRHKPDEPPIDALLDAGAPQSPVLPSNRPDAAPSPPTHDPDWKPRAPPGPPLK